MPESADKAPETFRIGLTMAGAISAGAYTAGVFDYLIEALEAWQAAKAAQRDGGVPPERWEIPDHDVEISVLSGASAGGMTAALGLLALAGDAGRESFNAPSKITGVLPTLYTAWVVKPRMLESGTMPGLLGMGDLEAPASGGITAALNGKVLTSIVDGALRNYSYRNPPRPYIATDLNLFLTTSNLRGVPYRISFTNANGGTSYYEMTSHADWVHFKVKGVGSGQFTSPWQTAAQHPPVFRAIDMAHIKTDGTWAAYSSAALATGAFPIGLPARVIEGVTRHDYDVKRWPLDKAVGLPGQIADFTLPTAFPDPPMPGADASYVAADGGVINNEPFELARWSLMDHPPQDEPGTAEECRSAVILIDPFPEGAPYRSSYDADLTLPGVAKAVIGALKAQVRFKADELLDALAGSLYSRYMIAPSRRDPVNNEPLREAIACGLLGGFGGFVDEAFRQHDYQLGRVNCHAFLTRYFSVPADNRIIKRGYGPLLALPSDDPRRQRFATRGVAQTEYQIIPVLTPKPEPFPWPTITREHFEVIVAAAVDRAGAVVRRLNSGTMGGVISALWFIWGKRKARKAIRKELLADLYARRQLTLPVGVTNDPLAALVLSALAAAGDEGLTVDRIVARIHDTVPAGDHPTLAREVEARLLSLIKAGMAQPIDIGYRLTRQAS